LFLRASSCGPMLFAGARCAVSRARQVLELLIARQKQPVGPLGAGRRDFLRRRRRQVPAPFGRKRRGPLATAGVPSKRVPPQALRARELETQAGSHRFVDRAKVACRASRGAPYLATCLSSPKPTPPRSALFSIRRVNYRPPSSCAAGSPVSPTTRRRAPGPGPSPAGG